MMFLRMNSVERRILMMNLPEQFIMMNSCAWTPTVVSLGAVVVPSRRAPTRSDPRTIRQGQKGRT